MSFFAILLSIKAVKDDDRVNDDEFVWLR